MNRSLASEAGRLGSIRTFVRNALAYSGSSFLAQVAGILQKYLVRGVLSPVAIGWWELAVVIQGFVSSVDPGLESAAAVELPVLHGQNDSEEQTAVRSTVLISHVVTGAVLAVGVATYAFWNRVWMEKPQFLSWLTGAALILIASASDSVIIFHQGRQTYPALGKALFASSVTMALMLPAGAYVGGITGLLASGVLAFTLRAVYLFVATSGTGIHIEPKWNRETFMRLCRFGLPLRIVEYPAAFFTYFDVFLIARYLGPAPLAIYTTARVVVMQVANVPGYIGSVLVMRLFHLTG